MTRLPLGQHMHRQIRQLGYKLLLGVSTMPQGQVSTESCLPAAASPAVVYMQGPSTLQWIDRQRSQVSRLQQATAIMTGVLLAQNPLEARHWQYACTLYVGPLVLTSIACFALWRAKAWSPSSFSLRCSKLAVARLLKSNVSAQQHKERLILPA